MHKQENKSDQDLDSVLREISDLLITKPLESLDRAIDALANSAQYKDNKFQNKLVNLFARACLCFSGSGDGINTEHPVDDMFSPAMASSARRQIAVAVARLLAQFPDLETRPNMSQRIVALFDDTLSDNIYRMAKIDRGTQSFVKLREIGAFISTTERDLLETISRVTSVSDVTGFRSQYLKKINSGSARVIIHPFLPAVIREERISHFFGKLEAYGASSGLAVLESYNQIKDAAAELAESADAIGSRYSQILTKAMVTRFVGIVTEDFLRTPFSKQADIRLDLGDKNYPLQVESAAFPLELAIVNNGPGYAFDVVVRVKEHVAEEGEIEFLTSQVELGGVEPGPVLIEFPCRVVRPGSGLCVEFECSWKNFDQTRGNTSVMLELKEQRTGIPWEEAETADPYSLSPVATANELVGRVDILNRLLALTKGTTVESAFIRGQKRVGKTSIVKALQSRLKQLFPKDYAIAFLEAGDYIAHDAKQTIELLGQSICREVRSSDKRLSKLEEPVFSGGLATLNGFLQDALAICPGYRMLFILDEFDELPLEVYKRGMIGDAFFRTIRSISNKSEFGFVLVGGEKMEYVLSNQGDALNRFERFSVDYFDKQNSWTDFQDLVRRPSAEYLDFSDSAVNEIYDVCAGNPYFAKLICKTLFASMIKRRDCYVSRREVAAAVDSTLSQIGSNSFAHFWQDGISELPPRSEEISVVRRKVLLSWSDCMRSTLRSIPGVTADDVVKAAQSIQVPDMQVKHELRDFERRQVLLSADGRYSAKVTLFGRWLVERGYQEIVTTMLDRDALISLKNQEEINRVKEDEISRLVSRWDLFLGQRITNEVVRVWISQFKGIDNQRLAFRLLQGLHFYSIDLIRQKMREIHGIVTRQIIWQRKARQPKRRDLIVSAIGGLGHSGAEYARRYADENQIYPDNVVTIDQIPEAIQGSDSEVKAVVFVDDFIGTGETLASELSKIPVTVRQALNGKGLSSFVLVIAGYSDGVRTVQRAIDELDFSLDLHVCDLFRSEEALLWRAR
jgi:hypothetical protein